MLSSNFFSAPFHTMLRDHFLRVLDEIQRKHPIPTTKDDWLARRELLTNKLSEYLDPILELADRTSLNAEVTGVIGREGYRIENVLFESLPNLWVTASAYVPINEPCPVPGILCLHGHFLRGRYDSRHQAACIGLALRGYLVLSLDMVGFNERAFMSDFHSNTEYLLMSGVSMQAIDCLDNMRAIDYLCSRPDVDNKKIGCTGCSGGGNHTMYVAALDKRIKAAVPICSVERFVNYLGKGVSTCEQVPGIAAYADIPDICSLIAPRALLVISGTLDITFPIASVRQAVSRISDIYRLVGADQRFNAVEVYSGHDLNREMREIMYSWFDQWFTSGKSNNSCIEPNMLTESEHSTVLHVFKKEHLSQPRETISSLYYKLSQKLPLRTRPEKKELECSQEKMRQDIRKLFGWPKAPEILDIKKGDFEECQDYEMETSVYRSEKDIWIPTILFRRHRRQNQPPVIMYLSPRGKKVATELRHISLLLKRGFTVASIDYRGIGETTSSSGYEWAWASSVIIGLPIFGMRVWDIVCGIRYLCSREDIENRRLYLWGEGEAGLLSLFAAGLEGSVEGVIAERCLVSYKGKGKESFKGSLEVSRELVIPGILQHADVCDVISLIAPRYVLFANGISIEGNRIDKCRAEQCLKPAEETYVVGGASKSFEILVGSNDEVTKKVLELV